MNEHDKLLNALVRRAEDDARKFREENPQATPNDVWIENSYTAALPLAKDDAGIDPGRGPHPDLFDAYRSTIVRRVGERIDRSGTDELAQMPTPGER